MKTGRHFQSSRKFNAWHFCFCLLPSYFFLSAAAAAEIDESKLPPPAAGKVDFARDIKPILDNSCLRCHGPERPKSRFRLDNRESALKGGAKGVDILPGNSAKSLLIHYVSRLVEDMEMPPSGKGEPLTARQVGSLRAWIDQGAAWGAATNNFTFSTSLELGGVTVRGDAQKFREHYWQKNGVNGGAREFELTEQTSPDTTVSVTGHALLDDYKVNLFLDKAELGFIHTGFEQYRKYYDDTGGYYPAFSPSTSRLGRDLHLELGKAWIDFGLTLPDWPRLVLGYEYDYRRGEEAVTQWGSVTQGGITRNVAPASKEIDERMHIIKFNLDHEIEGVRIEESFRGEFYNLNTRQTNNSLFNGGSDAREGSSYFQGANTIRLEKQFNDWLLGSAGYLYSKLNADATFTLDAISPFVDQHWRAPEIALQRESHVVNLNSLLGPFDGLTISAGAQSEWTRQKGFGSASFDTIIPGAPPLTLANPATFSSDYDKSSVQENLALRYTKIPFTTLFAEARLEQQRIGQFEQLADPLNNPEPVLLKTEFSSQLTDFRAGFNTSPWQSVSLSAHYRRYEDDSHYHPSLNQQSGSPTEGYIGFINERDLLTDEVETKLAWHPRSWLKTSFSYQLLTTRYRTTTAPVTDPFFGNISPGGGLEAGKYDSHIYSINTTLTPFQRLYLSTTFSYQDSSTHTANNGALAIAPYRGDIYSVFASGTYIFTQNTDLFANYSFSDANYGQNNFADGLPVGMKYQQHGIQGGIAHRFGKNATVKLQYGYYYYSEPGSGGANNYTANAIFGVFTFRIP
jgi:hypothetical protein